jgi:hypothetical protein
MANPMPKSFIEVYMKRGSIFVNAYGQDHDKFIGIPKTFSKRFDMIS